MNFDELEDEAGDITGATPQGSPSPGMQSFDELPDESQTAQAPQQAAPQGSFDDLVDDRTAPGGQQPPADSDEPSAAGAFTRAAIKAAPVGAIAGVGALQAGAVGLGLGTAAAPFLGPAAPAGPVVGALLGGVAGGLGYGWIANWAEDKILAALGWDKEGPLGSDQMAKDKAAHPYAQFGGELAGQIGPAFGMGAVTKTARVLGGAIGGGVEAGTELYQEGQVDPLKVAGAVAANAAFAKPRAWAERSANVVTPKSYRTGNQPENIGGKNDNPDLKPIADEPAPPQSADAKPDIEVVQQAPTPPQMEQANATPIVARGVATEQPPAPEIPGVGHAGTEAKGPETYPKAGTTPGEQVPGVVETKSPVTPEVAAAIKGEPDQVRQPQASADVPAPGEAVPQPPAVGERSPPPPTPPSKVTELPQNAKPHRTDEPAVSTAAPENQAVSGKPLENIRPEPEPRPTGLTPAEINAATELRRSIKEAGYQKLLDAIDARKLNPRETVEALARAQRTLESQNPGEGRKIGGQQVVGRQSGEIRTETPKQKLASGAVTAGPKDLARKQGALDKYKAAFDEVGPDAAHWKDINPLDPKHLPQTKAAAKKSWERVKEIMGGDPFERGSGHYVPNMRDEAGNIHVQYLKALKRYAIGKSGSKDFAVLHTTPKLAPEERATGRVETDISRGRQVPEKSAEDITAVDAGLQSRETFEPLAPWKDRAGNLAKDQSFVEQSNELRKFVNELSPSEYDKLREQYKENFTAAVRDADNPAEVLADMRQTLAENPTRITTQKPVEAPAAKPAEVAASPGKSLKDTDPAKFAALKAQYEAQNKGPVLSKDEQIKVLNEKERAAKEATTRTEERGDTNPETVWNKVRDAADSFIQDESGAGLRNFVKNIVQRRQSAAPPPPPPNTPTVGPGAARNANHLSYAGDIHEGIRVAHANVLNTKSDIRTLLKNAEKAPLTPYEWRKLTLADQHKDLSSRPQNEQDVFNRYVKPVKDLTNTNIREIKDLQAKYPYLKIDLPELHGGIDVAYQPRNMKGKQIWDKEEDALFDAFGFRTLSGYSPNLKVRDFYALRDVGNDPMQSNLTGDRLIIGVSGDKHNGFEVSVLRKGQPPLKLKNLPSDFEGEVGNVLPLKVKGKDSRWQVDHAATDEIEKVTGGKVQYHENAMYSWAKAADDTTKALEQLKLKVQIMEDPRFKQFLTRSREVAEKNGWDLRETRLKDFEGYYMPKELRWEFDDYARAGFGGEGVIDKIRKFNVGVAKFINVNAPLVHVWNELDLGIVGRGYRWFWPPAYLRLGRAIPEAVRSVNKQDALQKEMRNAGTNPMLASSQAQSMYHDFMKVMGADMTVNAKNWDVIAKNFNMTTPQMWDKLQQKSANLTWRLSDYLATAHYLELKAEGNSPKQAADKINKFFSDYHVGTTIMGSRALQQMLVDPGTTLFGRYKAGVFRTFYHIANDIVGKQKTQAERLEALSQLAVLGALGLWGYDAVDKGLEKLTGQDEGAIHLRRRGASAFPGAVGEVLTGKKGPQAAVTHAWSPAPAIPLALGLAGNKDFRGKDIFPQGNWWEDPMIPAQGMASLGEHVLKNTVSPYNQISQGYTRDDDRGGVLGALRASAWEQVGVSEPTDRAQKFEQGIERFNARTRRQRTKRPEGVLPDLLNRFTQ